MKAEERARRAFKYIYGRIVEDMDKDVIAAWTAAIREAEQQAFEEAIKAIHAQLVSDTDDVGCGHVYNGTILDCEYIIRALIEREAG